MIAPPVQLAAAAPHPLAMSEADLDVLRELLSLWAQKRSRNVLRNEYVAGIQLFRDLGVALPPALKRAEPVIQWPATVVTALTDLVELDGFVAAGEGDDPWELGHVVEDNRLLTEVPMAAKSAATHGSAFLTVFQGDVEAGEPAQLILPHAADMAAALWDSRRRRIRAFLSVTSMAEDGQPDGLVMYLAEKVTILTRQDSGRWQVTARRNPLGVPSVWALPYNPDLERPFGRSRVSRSVMSYTDAALRTVLRSELSAEAYSSPQYWVLGELAGNVVGSDRWRAVTGRIFGLESDEFGNRPDVKRFEGASPTPHKEHLRQWAELLSADTGVPISSLGVVQDNPASAEAIFAQKEPLIVRAGAFTRSMSLGVTGAVRAALALRDGRPMEDFRSLRAMWADPSHTSPMGRADAHAKLSAVIPGFGESEVGLELAGLSREQIVRFREERRRASGVDLRGLLEQRRAEKATEAATGAPASVPDQPAAPQGDTPADMKAKLDALGAAIRSGVSPESAAAFLGLDGIQFTGAMPVSLRLPEAQADGLEEG